LPLYDLVFAAPRSNFDDFKRLGCARVRYLPFGCHETLFASPVQSGDTHNVLFVGGADPDRAAFLSVRYVAVVGGYWDDIPAFRPFSLGEKPPEAIRGGGQGKPLLASPSQARRPGHAEL